MKKILSVSVLFLASLAVAGCGCWNGCGTNAGCCTSSCTVAYSSCGNCCGAEIW